MNSNITTILSNPHLRWCAIIFAGIEIVALWLPEYKLQLEGTQKILMFYAIAVAANSTPPSGGNPHSPTPSYASSSLI